MCPSTMSLQETTSHLYGHLVEHPLFKVFQTFEFHINVDKGLFPKKKHCISEHFWIIYSSTCIPCLNGFKIQHVQLNTSTIVTYSNYMLFNNCMYPNTPSLCMWRYCWTIETTKVEPSWAPLSSPKLCYPYCVQIRA
jgi:hypothetical protein